MPPSVVAPPARRAEAEATCAPGWESAVFAAARGSVVRITDGEGWGAGFIWKTPRYVVTAMHVVDRVRSFTILFADGSRGRAHIIAGDRSTDLAILELDGDTPNLAPLELGDPASLALGVPIIAIGHPFARDRSDERDEGLRAWTITRGVLGARNEHQIQIDAPLNPGNSGGPVLDCTGRVIGVVSRVSGTLGFASAPKDLLGLDASKRTPSVSFAPEPPRLRLGLSVRASHFASYGPFADLDVAFLRDLHVMARANALVNVTSTVDAERVVTSRTGIQLYAGAGYDLRHWRSWRLRPHVGVARFGEREHAVTFANGRASDSSRGLTSLRFTPGLALTTSTYMLDYRIEIDAGAFASSAHLVSGSIAFF